MIRYGMRAASAPAGVPNTASMSGPAVARSGIATSTSDGARLGSASNHASRRSCSTSSCRARLWHTCTSTPRSAGGSPSAASGCRSRIAFCTRASHVGAGLSA
ncbi:putative exodeoxyribonuclease V, gamma subunit [Burkholderia mallei]|nr:putative exodeoxyribonuclease V, gamma subunit [Burkholderia mallei]